MPENVTPEKTLPIDRSDDFSRHTREFWREKGSSRIMREVRELRGQRSSQAKTYCLYEAPKAEAIREAARRLHAPADVIVEVGELLPKMFA
jgi:hypothetical protein